MKTKVRLFALLLASLAAFVLWGCSSNNSKSFSGSDRWPASDCEGEYCNLLKYDAKAVGGNVEFQPTQSTEDIIGMWHWAEGADIYPLKWMVHLKSATFDSKSFFLEDLDKKYGLIRVPEKYNSPFVLPWVGLTAAWSSVRSSKDGPSADVLLSRNRNYSNMNSKESEKISEVLGKKTVDSVFTGGKVDSIAMAGTNCALCHTGEIKNGSSPLIVDGAPAMFSAQGFFRDLFRSTVKIMIVEKELVAFLKANGVTDEKKIDELKELSEKLVRQISVFGTGRTSIGKTLTLLVLKKIRPEAKVMRAFYNARPIFDEMLVKMLKYTYDLDEVSPELQRRMEWLTVAMTPDPSVKTVEPGWGRTDAFGRIGNLVARGKKKSQGSEAERETFKKLGIGDSRDADLTANVSFPPMWGIKYKAMFHYSANTNSVMVRNVGQSYGLGSVTIGMKDIGGGKEVPISTTDFVNLNRLEQEIQKIKVPQWEKTMGDIGASIEDLEQGCNTYTQKCSGCHQPGERVGPQKKLIEDWLVPVSKVGTDKTYFDEQIKPVRDRTNRQVSFHEALGSVTAAIADGYFETHGRDIKSDRKDFFSEDVRGAPIVRGTFYGQSGCKDGSDCYTDMKANKEQYPAPSLAGIWASAPYLHNGSVPTLEALLSPEQRPEIFFTGSKKYLKDKLGFEHDHSIAVSKLSSVEWGRLQLRWSEKKKQQFVCSKVPDMCFDTREPGNSNKGHNFAKGLNAEEKANLIHFLKVLRPQPEYAWQDSKYKYIIHEPLAGNPGHLLDGEKAFSDESNARRICRFKGSKSFPGEFEKILAGGAPGQ